MKSSESITTIAPAIVKMQTELKHAVKDSTNPFFNSKYADLAAVWEADHEALAKNGLAIIQTHIPAQPGCIGLETILMHTSGEWISGEAYAALEKAGPQVYGSATTYLRRYGRQAITGVVSEDDDGEAATIHAMPAPTERKSRYN